MRLIWCVAVGIMTLIVVASSAVAQQRTECFDPVMTGQGITCAMSPPDESLGREVYSCPHGWNLALVSGRGMRCVPEPVLPYTRIDR